MMQAAPRIGSSELMQQFSAVRQQTLRLCAPLQVDDFNIQTMPDVSPTKWHLAHTSWFFETFVLLPHASGYRVYRPEFAYLFNSYYETVGARHARPRRGQLSRPTVDEVLAYRAHVDTAMADWLPGGVSPEIAALINVGLQHEQQHQELLLTDIKHVLGSNPLHPAYHPEPPPAASGHAREQGWLAQPEGLYEIGHAGEGFGFDNEGPRHRVWLGAFALADRPVTQGEWLAFMADAGYTTASLWLSDGWDWVNAGERRAPLYWFHDDGGWQQYTMAGAVAVDEQRPVAHLSFYEAEAYARWAGARLPAEAEWEVLAAQRRCQGDFQETGRFEPQVTAVDAPGADSDFFYGGVWEWTASAYAPYPGYRPPAGALGEYNAKFMASQLVLRGGSCVTPAAHARASYRNFFYPQQQWQYSGLRLARDD